MGRSYKGSQANWLEDRWEKRLHIISIHWGLSLGGVAKYAATLEGIRAYLPVRLRSLCILNEGRVVDGEVLELIDPMIVHIKSVFDLSWVSKVRRIIAQEKPDCVISHGFNGHLVGLIGCMGMEGRINRLASYHGSYHATTPVRKIVEPLYNGFTHWYLKHKVDAVVNVAQYCADFLVAQGVAQDKTSVIHNGIPDLTIEDSARENIRNEWRVAQDDVVIGAASRLDPVKGLNCLIKAFARIAFAHPKACLVVMGDGVDRDDLESQAVSTGVGDRVRFVGMRSDVLRCLSALDIFALPSLAEYHSIALLEAMRAGLSIVATDVGGNTESVRAGQEALIVKPADSDGLAAALERLLADMELRKRLGMAARERFLAEYTEEVMLRKTAHWLRSVCEKQTCG